MPALTNDINGKFICIIIFEIFHETAFEPSIQAIKRCILREPSIPEPFEIMKLKDSKGGTNDIEKVRTATGNLLSGSKMFDIHKSVEIHYFYDRALSLLANVYNKLNYGFYDPYDKPDIDFIDPIHICELIHI